MKRIRCLEEKVNAICRMVLFGTATIAAVVMVIWLFCEMVRCARLAW